MTITESSTSALEAHIADYLADAKPANTLATIDAIEHGWYGATAEAAEKVEAIRAGYLTGELTLRGLFVAIEKLAEELKSEVGA